MKKAKRALALALVFALVASFCVTGAAAAPGEGPTQDEPSSYVKNGQTVTTEDRVAVSKTAVRTGENAYNITLEVTIPDNVTVPGTDTDVVLVIDSSGSMGRSGMSDAKEAAADFAEELFKATGVTIRVAIVDYDDSASVVSVNGKSWLTNNNQVERALDQISAGGGTHIQGGIHEARELLASSDNKKVMIVISDGEPTYSFRPTSVSGTITGCYYEWFGYGEHNISNAKVEGESLEFDGFVYNYNRYADNREHRDGGTLGSGGTGSTASWDISWTCEHEDQSGTDEFSYSHAWPTIAEAGFAKADNVEIYSVYIGSLSGNAETTMEGIASGTDHCASTEGTSLSALLEEIAGDVTSTTAGAVTDPMGENIVLGDVSGLGVTVEGNTLSWNPRNGEVNDNGSTTYTVTYPITVDGEALKASGWLEANGRTTFSYRVNGEHKTVDFNVPQVWGEKVETEQNVYVYVQVVNDDKSELKLEQIEQIHGWGLTTLNYHGYYTIGVMPNITLPVASADYSNGLSQDEINAVATSDNLSTIEKHSDNAGFIIDEKIEWVKLHTDGGADGYSNPDEEYYVSSSTPCWHLNGQITLTELKQELVDVVYQDGVDGSAFPNQTYKAYPGTATPAFNGTPERKGFTFNGWRSSFDEQVYSADELADMTVPNKDVTYTATWSQNTNEVYIKVYLDDEDVTAQYNTYLSGLTTTGTTSGIGEIKYENGHVVVPYAYEDIDAADVKFSVNSGYVLQGVSGEFVYGSSGWDGVKIENGTWTVDNVDGGSTLKVYLNTKYSVEYVVPSSLGPAPTDPNTYITVEGLQDVSAPNFDGVTDGNTGVSGGWTNNNLETTINLKTVPTGTTGWYNENDFLYTQPTLNVSDAAAASSGYDNNGDHIFTFTATAKEYTVTYHANTSADDPTLYTDSNTVTHGESYTVLGNDTTNFNNTGYTFAGWATSADGDVVYQAGEEITDIKENVNLYAKWTAITGTLTVTKTVEADKGTVTLPDAFTITVTGTSGAAEGDSYTLTIGMSDDENIEYSYDEASGAYKWVISGAALGNYSVSERNTQVSGYKLDTSASTQSDTMTLTDTATSDSAELKNVYVKDAPGLGVEKTVYSVNGNTTVPEKVKVDDVIVYQIVVKNTGNVALTNISVTDTLGEETLTVYTDAACTTPATTFGLAVDESEQFYAKYEVTADDAEAGSVKNTATAKAGEDGPEDSGEVTVNVTPQYTLTVEYYYDSISEANRFYPSEVTLIYPLNEGDGWSVSTETGATHVAPETVEDDEGIQFVLDTELPITSDADGIKTDVVVELVYARDEWKDGTPDYKQARIVYEVAGDSTGMGRVSPESRVVTLNLVDGTYKDSVTAESTAIPEDGNVFVKWSWTHDVAGTSTNETLSHEFTAVGGEEYVYTASFKTGTTDAEVTKTLVSYTRDDVTVDEIPEGFKARVGDVLNYEITIENTGEVALNTTVTDSITGAGTLTINAGEGYTVEDGKIIISGLAPEGTVTITASYTVVAADAGKTITNTATADLPGDDDPTGEEEVTVDEYGITVTPADITIYMGGDAGYEAVVGENGQVISDNNTLPTPLFTVELSESFGELSVEQIEAIVIAGTTSDEGTRGWRFDYAGETEDGEDLYYIVPDEGQDPIRVTYTNAAGEEVVSDHFDPAAIDELFAEFAIKLYTGTVTSVTAEVNGITCEIDYSGTGTLTVRAVDDTDENPVVGVQEALPRPVEAGEGAVTAPAGTTYTLNETTVQAEAEGVGLLFDGIIDDGADRTGALLAELESELGVTVEDGNYQAQYLDLVDAHNGNAWVKASGEVTVYWGYPEGTDEGTDFALYHFEGLHREGENSGFDIEDVATSDIERVQITKTANGIAFDIGSGGFSPFVLVWDDGDGGDKPWWPPIGPGDDDDDGDDDVDREFVPKWLNIDDHYAYIIGYEDGTVRPQGNITRAEVATIFFRLLTDEVREEYWSTESGYSDVSSSDWYNNAISTLSNLGVITGYEDGTFRPNASISRAEFVTIATRFFDYTAEYEGTFSDVSYLSWYADFVQAAVDMGLVNGYENGTFRPNASITRAEAVAIVNRVLLRRPDAEHLLPWSVMNTFSDNVLESAWYYEDIQEATNSHDYEWLKSGVEDWTEKLPERDWAALEREWSSAYDAPGGEVTG